MADHASIELEYARPGTARPERRDPMSYYREPPTISTWGVSELVAVLVPILIVFGLFAVGIWRLLSE
jgi:hypothetical protein